MLLSSSASALGYHRFNYYLSSILWFVNYLQSISSVPGTVQAEWRWPYLLERLTVKKKSHGYMAWKKKVREMRESGRIGLGAKPGNCLGNWPREWISDEIWTTSGSNMAGICGVWDTKMSGAKGKAWPWVLQGYGQAHLPVWPWVLLFWCPGAWTNTLASYSIVRCCRE